MLNKQAQLNLTWLTRQDFYITNKKDDYDELQQINALNKQTYNSTQTNKHLEGDRVTE